MLHLDFSPDRLKQKDIKWHKSSCSQGSIVVSNGLNCKISSLTKYISDAINEKDN